MNSKIIFITGATGGIGKAAALALSKQQHHIIIHGRDRYKADQVKEEIIRSSGNNKVDVVTADLFSIDDTIRLANEMRSKYKRIDVLINNAGGIMNVDRQTTVEGHEKTIALNLFAPFILSALLLDSLKKSNNGRIINISSNAHSLNAKPDFNDLQSEKSYNPLAAYGNAKLFLIWITEQLTLLLQKQGISNVTVNTMHPGAVASNFGVDSNLGGFLNVISKIARIFFRSVDQGAETIVYMATSNEVATVSGQYFVDRKIARVSKKYFSDTRRKLIWDYCLRVTNVNPFPGSLIQEFDPML